MFAIKCQYTREVIYTSTTAENLRDAVNEAVAKGVDVTDADLRTLDPEYEAKKAKEANFLRQFDARTRKMGMHKKSKKNSINADTAY